MYRQTVCCVVTQIQLRREDARRYNTILCLRWPVGVIHFYDGHLSCLSYSLQNIMVAPDGT